MAVTTQGDTNQQVDRDAEEARKRANAQLVAESTSMGTKQEGEIAGPDGPVTPVAAPVAPPAPATPAPPEVDSVLEAGSADPDVFEKVFEADQVNRAAQFAGPVERMTLRQLRQQRRRMRPEFRQTARDVTGETEQDLKDAAEGMGIIKEEMGERQELKKQARRTARGRNTSDFFRRQAERAARAATEEAAAKKAEAKAKAAQEEADAEAEARKEKVAKKSRTLAPPVEVDSDESSDPRARTTDEFGMAADSETGSRVGVEVDEFGMPIDSESEAEVSRNYAEDIAQSLAESDRVVDKELPPQSDLEARDASPDAEAEYHKDQFYRDVAAIENPVEIAVPEIMLDKSAPENQANPAGGKKVASDLQSLLYTTHSSKGLGTQSPRREEAFYALRDKLATLVPDGVEGNPEDIAGLAVARIRMPEFTSGQVDINTLVGQAINEAIEEHGQMLASSPTRLVFRSDPFQSDPADYKFHQARLNRFETQIGKRVAGTHRVEPYRPSRD